MFLLFAAVVASQPVTNVGFDELMRGEDAAAIAAIGADDASVVDDPAQLINLGIAHARRGEGDLAKQCFKAVIDAREVIELQTSTGAWIDARTIARQGLAMLDRGVFTSSRLARN